MRRKWYNFFFVNTHIVGALGKSPLNMPQSYWLFCLLFFTFFFFFFLMWTTFKVFLYFCYHIASVLRFDSLTTKHVESSFPNKGLNPHHLHWKAKSQPLDQQGSPSYWLYWTKVTKETVRVGSGREVQEGRDIYIYIYLWLIHVDIW